MPVYTLQNSKDSIINFSIIYVLNIVDVYVFLKESFLILNLRTNDFDFTSDMLLTNKFIKSKSV